MSSVRAEEGPALASSRSEWTVEQMYELGSRHARLEAQGDLEATLATLVEEPVYEFWPMGWSMSGRERVRRYYEHLLGHFVPQTRGYRLLDEWVSRTSVAQEYEIQVEAEGGALESHRVIGVLFADGPLLSGERIYASERCVRQMAGDDLIDEIASLG